MKLRIMGNTLRLRLSQREIEKLGKEGIVSDASRFPNNMALTYTLESSSTETLACSLSDNTILITIPEITVNEWVNTDVVGFDKEFDLQNNSKLSILVEKDFKCLTDRPGEDEADLFPNPSKSH
jgi:hypothetical protein